MLVALVVAALLAVATPTFAGAQVASWHAPVSAASAPTPSPATATPTPIGTIETFGSDLRYVTDMAPGPDGNLWLADGGGIGRMGTDGTLRIFPLPTTSTPHRITADPDGNIWFTTFDTIGRMSPSGERTIMAASVHPQDITGGPDGNVWFTTRASVPDARPGSISRISPSGVVTTFASPDIESPGAIVAGSDDNLWFTDSGAIGRITPTGSVTRFPVPELEGPWRITLGPDGNVWFAESTTIGSITSAGEVSLYQVVTGSVGDLAPGSDGNVWFSAGGTDVGAITPTGEVAITEVLPSSGWPSSMALGADGDIWVARQTSMSAGVVRISPAGEVTAVPTPVAQAPWGISAGPDGHIWFTAMGSSTIARTDRSGIVTSFQGAGMDWPTSIVEGPDHNLWFTNWGSDSIGRITPGGVVSNVTAPGLEKPSQIVAGADDDLWFTMDGSTELGRITSTGAVTFVPLSFEPADLIAGPDGNLWVTDYADAVWRVTTDGVATRFTAPGVDRSGDMVAGPGGAMWFTNDHGPNQGVGRIAPSGAITLVPTPGLTPSELAFGPDGNLWFTTYATRQIGRITPDGAVAAIAEPNGRTPYEIVGGDDGAVWYTDVDGSLGRIAVTADGAPDFVVAEAGKESAIVSWAAPPVVTGGPIVRYEVSASPGGASCATPDASARSCAVSGLTAGVAYTFSVVAVTSGGPGPAGVTAVPVTPWSGSGFHAVVPERILDSRKPDKGFAGRVTSATARSLTVTGLGGASNVPAGASAVVLNVTVVDSTRESYLTVFPAGSGRPTASNLNFGAGQVVANLVTVKVGAGGMVDVATADGSTHVVADVVGWYDDGTTGGDRFNARTPVRVLDSRTVTGGWHAKLRAEASRDLVVRQTDNSGSVPVTASAVVANVTVTGGDAQSFVSVWPSGEDQPGVSNLNLLPGQTIANLVTVKIGENGAIRFANAVGDVDVIVDVVGWFDPTQGSRFHVMEPNRVLDTRTGKGLSGAQRQGQTRALAVAGASGTGVPVGATGLVANLTVADGTAESFVAVFPGGMARPVPFSNVNAGANQVVPNLVAVAMAPDGTVNLYNHLGSTALIADVVGWYAPT